MEEKQSEAGGKINSHGDGKAGEDTDNPLSEILLRLPLRGDEDVFDVGGV
jgi:hypothetical protein